MIELYLKNPDARLLLKALHGPSTTDPRLASVYEYIEAMLADAASPFPWRTVTGTSDSSAYRGNGVAAYLKLECGHSVREVGVDKRQIERSLEAGKAIRRRCRECAGGRARRAEP